MFLFKLSYLLSVLLNYVIFPQYDTRKNEYGLPKHWIIISIHFPLVRGAESITSKWYRSQLTFNQSVDISIPLLATSKRDLLDF